MQKQKKVSFRQRWDDLQPSKTMLVWSCLGCAAVAVIAGFTWGGWVTGGTAQEMAQDAADSSRYELASTICADHCVCMLRAFTASYASGSVMV